jgi:hypothetical protein
MTASTGHTEWSVPDARVRRGVEPGSRVLTSDGVDIGCVDQVMRRAGSPPCLVLSIGSAARHEHASVVVTAADVAVEGGTVRLRHVAQDDLGCAGWARPGSCIYERERNRRHGEPPAAAWTPHGRALQRRTT